MTAGVHPSAFHYKVSRVNTLDLILTLYTRLTPPLAPFLLPQACPQA